MVNTEGADEQPTENRGILLDPRGNYQVSVTIKRRDQEEKFDGLAPKEYEQMIYRFNNAKDYYDFLYMIEGFLYSLMDDPNSFVTFDEGGKI